MRDVELKDREGLVRRLERGGGTALLEDGEWWAQFGRGYEAYTDASGRLIYVVASYQDIYGPMSHWKAELMAEKWARILRGMCDGCYRNDPDGCSLRYDHDEECYLCQMDER